MIFRPYPRFGALCATLFLPLSACNLLGIEGEEIDVVDEGETGGGTFSSASGDGDGESGDGDGDSGDGDGDGDGDSGDGDGDSGDGDGDSGDGDGDGDGDGTDSGDGDGDGDGAGCAPFAPAPIFEGINMASIVDGGSQLEASCGAPGPEAVYSFTPGADGLYQFAVTGTDLELALYVLTACEPLEELACIADPDPLIIQQMLTGGQTYYIVIDSFGVGGDAVIEITLQ